MAAPNQQSTTGGTLARMRELFRAARKDSWVLPYLGQYRKALCASLLLGSLAVIFAAGLMFASGYLISDAAERPELGLFSLLVPLGFVQIFGLGKPFLSYAERLASHDWVLRITASLQSRLFGAIGTKGMFWARTRRAGEFLGLLSDDIAHIQDLYLRSIFPAAIALIAWIVVTVVFGMASPAVAAILCVALFVLIALVPLAATLANAARTARTKQATRTEYDLLSDATQGMTDWVISGRRQDFVETLAAAGHGRAQAQEQLDASLRRFELAEHLLFTLMSACVLVWAAVHFQSSAGAGVGDLRAEDWIAAFVLGIFPLLDAFAPLPRAAAASTKHLESIERLNELDGEPRAEAERNSNTDSQPSPSDGSINITGMSFHYPNEATDVLQDITLNIPAGQKLIVLGPSGCGKSTLLSIIRGDLTPTQGNAQLGGIATCSLGDAASKYISLIEQQPHVFNRTLFENIALGDASITRDAAQQALEAAGLSALLERLPQGLDTVAGEGGSRFSGGERHRIALARALARDTRVVLFDEPTASLDPLTELKLIETILASCADRTVIFVTHHLANVELFDRVLLLGEGHVQLDGSPTDLYNQSEHYRALLTFDRGL